MAYPDSRIKWHQLGLVPTTNMAFWHQYEAGVSGHDTVADYSGNARNLAGGTVDPVLGTNLLNGQPAWYFNGSTTDPLKWTGAISVVHMFVLAAAEGAAFDLNRGLLTGVTSGDLLTSNNTGTTFFDLGITPDPAYKKSGVTYAENNMQAPMNSRFELIEYIANAGAWTPDGIQVGRQRDIAGRIWKGWWADQMGFTGELGVTARRRVLLYYALRYGVHLVTGSQIPLYFPSKDLVRDTGAVHSRFYHRPRRWQEVTESYEFQDANSTFNEFGDNPPQRWEYSYEALTKGEVVLFDVFNDTAREAQPFYFKDPESNVWSNVRIDRGGYSRIHRDHMRWKHEVSFDLIGINSAATYEEFLPPEEPLTFIGTASATDVELEWT
jgi:hypothetical protein